MYWRNQNNINPQSPRDYSTRIDASNSGANHFYAEIIQELQSQAKQTLKSIMDRQKAMQLKKEAELAKKKLRRKTQKPKNPLEVSDRNADSKQPLDAHKNIVKGENTAADHKSDDTLT